MGTFSGSINSQDTSEGLDRIQEALSQLEQMSVVVELDHEQTDFDSSFSTALGAEGRQRRQPKSEKMDTIKVNRVRSTHPWLDPWGHATISIDDDPAVGLEPNSTASAAAGFAEDLAEAMGHGPGSVIPTPNYVPAHVQTDYRIPESYAVIHVTVKQARAARAFIRQAEHNPQIYDFLYANCAQWVEEVLAAAGLDMPNEEAPGDLVSYLAQRFPQ